MCGQAGCCVLGVDWASATRYTRCAQSVPGGGSPGGRAGAGCQRRAASAALVRGSCAGRSDSTGGACAPCAGTQAAVSSSSSGARLGKPLLRPHAHQSRKSSAATSASTVVAPAKAPRPLASRDILARARARAQEMMAAARAGRLELLSQGAARGGSALAALRCTLGSRRAADCARWARRRRCGGEVLLPLGCEKKERGEKERRAGEWQRTCCSTFA